MASLESILEKLNFASESLDQAAKEIHDLPLEPTKMYIRKIGDAFVPIFQLQQEIYRLNPSLIPDSLREEANQPDPELTPEQKQRVEQLTAKEIQEIDLTLLSNAKKQWRKVAMLVGLSMSNRKEKYDGIPDIFYSERVRFLVEQGFLESQGNLQKMRFSEVRLPSSEKPDET